MAAANGNIRIRKSDGRAALLVRIQVPMEEALAAQAAATSGKDPHSALFKVQERVRECVRSLFAHLDVDGCALDDPRWRAFAAGDEESEPEAKQPRKRKPKPEPEAETASETKPAPSE